MFIGFYFEKFTFIIQWAKIRKKRNTYKFNLIQFSSNAIH